ncbi:MAG: ZIP family metal transporter [Candidatus Woesearchaeota archaeon]|jgi:zinc and cadmium transporter|nr:ZIP family metal transporter [Candidatus Woesearchaeota archaeon]
MIDIFLYSLGSVFIVSFLSLIGILTFGMNTQTLKKTLIYMISFSAGALFGDVFLHLLPELVEEAGSFTLKISIYIMVGIIISLILEKIIHWRHCHMPITKEHVHPLSIMSLVGDTMHNFIDGIIIGVSYLVSIPVGIATTVAVIFHEIPQEIANYGVLIHGGFSQKKALAMNFITSLSAFLGLIIALIIGTKINGSLEFLISVAAGNFIYIAGSDLIPELHKESKLKSSILQITTFILGIFIMSLLLFLE